MYKIINVFLIIFLGLTTISCSTLESKVEKKDDKLEFAGDILNFSEVFADQPEENVRMIITNGYLRIDDGPQAEDFILYNRRNKIIYNVVSEEKSIMVIDSQDAVHDKKSKGVKPAFPILWNVESQTSNALMRSDDKNSASATHYRLKLNQKECYNLVTVDQGMENPLNAMREFRQSLAAHLKTQYKPQDGQECYEAVNIFTPINHLHQGFPIREWSIYGYQRFLVNHRKMIIFPKKLFELPEGFEKINL